MPSANATVRDTRRERRAAGLCQWGRCPEPASGRFCPVHENRYKETRTALFAARRAEGQCRCGERATPGRTQCERCLIGNRERQAETRGSTCDCGKPAKQRACDGCRDRDGHTAEERELIGILRTYGGVATVTAVRHEMGCEKSNAADRRYYRGKRRLLDRGRLVVREYDRMLSMEDFKRKKKKPKQATTMNWHVSAMDAPVLVLVGG